MPSCPMNAQEIFKHDRFATEATGVVLDQVSEHYAHCSLALTDMHRNAMGAVMGGVIFTLADLAFAAAANSEAIAAGESLQWVSLSSSIHYLATAKGDRLTAEAHCVKQGLTTCLYNIEVRDAQQRLVATIQTEGMRISDN